jgi:DNA recombination protein RmuC
VADHLVVGTLIGIASGIAALIVIGVVTLRRLDTARHGEGLRVHRALADLQRTLRHELGAVRRDLQAAASLQERQTEVLAGHQTSLTERAVEALRDHPLPALVSLADAQERRLAALADDLARLPQALADGLDHLRADTAGHDKDLRNEVLESLKAGLDEIRAGHAAQLEQIRGAVDDKVESSVERRLGERFRLVSERLELVSERLEHVHRGLGDVQTFAAGLGHLQRAVATVRLGGSKAGPARDAEAAARPRAPRRKTGRAAADAPPPAVEAPQSSAS